MVCKADEIVLTRRENATGITLSHGLFLLSDSELVEIHLDKGRLSVHKIEVKGDA
jgi:hypothetical protein